MKRNQVILIYGMPASGKYTMAKLIQEKCGGILFDNHYFYDMFIGITEETDERWNEFGGCVSDVRRAFLNVIRKFYPKKHHMRYIFTSVIVRGEKLPDMLRNFARDIDADFIPIELNVLPDILVARCDTEERKKRKKLHNKKRYNNFVNQWIEIAFHSRSQNKLVIDSSKLSPEETFKQIKKHLKKFD